MKEIDFAPFVCNQPSAFIIHTPFQALCAVAAIRQLDISHYLVVALETNNDSRFDQLISILNFYKISYDCCHLGKISYRIAQLRALFPSSSKYTRLFLGDIRYDIYPIVGCQFVKNGTDVIYLDDGSFTISLLKSTSAKLCSSLYLKILSRTRNLKLRFNLLTIYGGIPSEKYNIMDLNLSYLFDSESINGKSHKGVYVIGTNLNMYCHALGLKPDQYIDVLERILKLLRAEFPDEDVVFVPHGRDNSEYAMSLCKKYNCIFHRPKMNVEMYILQQQVIPKIIYGFTSSALFNLKKIFPSCKVINITLNYPNSVGALDYYNITQYYCVNGIEEMKLSL